MPLSNALSLPAARCSSLSCALCRPAQNTQPSAGLFLSISGFLCAACSMLIFVRIYRVLSPPTKALLYVFCADILDFGVIFAMAVVSLYYQMRAEFIPPDDFTCHFIWPFGSSGLLFVSIGQPVIAWTTLKTLQKGQLRRIFFGCFVVVIILYFLSLLSNPGTVIRGRFCSQMPNGDPSYFNNHGFLTHSTIFGMLRNVGTFFVSVLLYVRGWFVLRSWRKR